MQANFDYIACMNKTQYTIRNIPSRIDAAVRRKSRHEGKSLNKVLIEALSDGLGVSGETPNFSDLDDLAGTWVEDPEFDTVIEAMDQVDSDLWQ